MIINWMIPVALIIKLSGGRRVLISLESSLFTLQYNVFRHKNQVAVSLRSEFYSYSSEIKPTESNNRSLFASVIYTINANSNVPNSGSNYYMQNNIFPNISKCVNSKA